MEAALGVEVEDGSYRELDAPGYARATISPILGGLARFPAAAAGWGMVRAWRVGDGDWQPLVQSGLVRAGDVATLDPLEAVLYVQPAPVRAAETETDPSPLEPLRGEVALMVGPQAMPTIRRGEPYSAVFDLAAPLPADYPALRLELRLPGAASNIHDPLPTVAVEGAERRALRVSLTLAQVNALVAGRVYDYKVRPSARASVLFGAVYCAGEWG